MSETPPFYAPATTVPGNPRPIIFDCDPGNDDAVALLLTLAAPEHFDVLGITCVGGNVPIDRVCYNARQICELAGRSDIKIYRGIPGALIRDTINSDGAHGVTGMDGADLPEPSMPLQPENAVDFIITTLRNHPSKVTLFLTAPLTNMAVALRMAPDITEKIQEIVLMGGAITAGNVTPASEFNMYLDPHAAYVVFGSGVPITMIGLEITHKVTFNKERLAKLRAIGNEHSRQIANMMEATQDFDITLFETDGRAVHDACVPIFMMHPELFTGRMAKVQVDIWHHEHMGNTVVSFFPRHTSDANAFVPYEVDAEGVFDVMLKLIARYA